MIALVPMFVDSVRIYMRVNGLWLIITASILAVALSCTLICVRSTARKVPLNYILLFMFTICESIIVAYVIASVEDNLLVLIAATMTAAIVVGLTIYAWTTKTDFTLCWGMAWVIGFALFFFMIFAIFTGNELVYKVYLLLGVIAGGFYILIDTQLIMGGKTW